MDVRGFVHAPPLSTGTQGGQLQALAQHAQHVHDDDGTPDAFLGGRLHKNGETDWAWVGYSLASGVFAEVPP